MLLTCGTCGSMSIQADHDVVEGEVMMKPILLVHELDGPCKFQRDFAPTEKVAEPRAMRTL